MLQDTWPLPGLTRALSPRASLPWCLAVSSPGTVSQAEVRNSSTTPYCSTSLCSITFQTAADTRRTGGARSWRAANGSCHNRTYTYCEDRRRDITMDSTSSFIKTVTRRVWSPPQRPFRVCCHNRETRKGVTAGTLEELKERVCQALLLSLSVVSMSLVCEEDGTEVDSDEFLMTLPDNTPLMALEAGQTWRPREGTVVYKSQGKARTGRDIARVTFDLYRLSPKDVFGSLSVKATFQGLYSVSADFQCLGPKKVLREALRMASTLLHAAGHLLITSASLIRRIIEGAELWQPQRAEYVHSWD